MYSTEKKSNGRIWLVIVIVFVLLGIWYLKATNKKMPVDEVQMPQTAVE